MTNAPCTYCPRCIDVGALGILADLIRTADVGSLGPIRTMLRDEGRWASTAPDLRLMVADLRDAVARRMVAEGGADADALRFAFDLYPDTPADAADIADAP